MLTRDIEYREPREGEVASYLSIRAKEMKAYGDELKIRPCPKCNHDNPKNMALQVNIKNGLWTCFKCNANGNWFTLTRSFGDPLPKNDRYKNPMMLDIDIDLANFFEEQKRRAVTENNYPKLLEYLHDRGFTNETLNKWRITSKGGKMIRIPIFQWDYQFGKWVMVNAKIRVCLDKEKSKNTDWFDSKGGETQLLLGNHLLKSGSNIPKTAWIFEGQWDAMTATELGIENAFSLPNGATAIHSSKLLRYIPNDWDILICMDMDEAGDKAAEKFFAQLGPDKVKRIVLPKPYKDLNEWYIDNPFLDKSEVFECIKNPSAELARSRTTERFMEINLEADEKKIKQICSTPWNGLNKIISILPGQTTGFLAPSGQGKSTWCNQLAVHVAAMGIKVGLISLEGPRDEFNLKLATVIRSTYIESDQTKIRSNLKTSRLFGTEVTTDQIVDECRFMASNENCRILIIDNLDYLEGIDNLEKARAYKKIINICLHMECHALMVWQPHKVDRSKVVNSGQQKGFSTALQDADNYLNFNRFETHVRLEVEKCRALGTETNNPAVNLIYDKQSNSFIQTNKPTMASIKKDPFFGGKIIPLAR